jgi:hypothetical protein
MGSKLWVGFVGALVLALGAWSGEAHANATCTSVVANYTSSVGNGWYDFELTIHRTDIWDVTYSRGTIQRNGTSTTWPLRGSSNQLFSDRYAGNQPFNINAADQLTVWISSTGQLYIYYAPWNFSTSWDMGCSGNTFTAIVPGYGVVTLTLRGWNVIG